MADEYFAIISVTSGQPADDSASLTYRYISSDQQTLDANPEAPLFRSKEEALLHLHDHDPTTSTILEADACEVSEIYPSGDYSTQIRLPQKSRVVKLIDRPNFIDAYYHSWDEYEMQAIAARALGEDSEEIDYNISQRLADLPVSSLPTFHFQSEAIANATRDRLLKPYGLTYQLNRFSNYCTLTPIRTKLSIPKNPNKKKTETKASKVRPLDHPLLCATVWPDPLYLPAFLSSARALFPPALCRTANYSSERYYYHSTFCGQYLRGLIHSHLGFPSVSLNYTFSNNTTQYSDTPTPLEPPHIPLRQFNGFFTALEALLETNKNRLRGPNSEVLNFSSYGHYETPDDCTLDPSDWRESFLRLSFSRPLIRHLRRPTNRTPLLRFFILATAFNSRILPDKSVSFFVAARSNQHEVCHYESTLAGLTSRLNLFQSNLRTLYNRISCNHQRRLTGFPAFGDLSSLLSQELSHVRNHTSEVPHDQSPSPSPDEHDIWPGPPDATGALCASNAGGSDDTSDDLA